MSCLSLSLSLSTKISVICALTVLCSMTPHMHTSVVLPLSPPPPLFLKRCHMLVKLRTFFITLPCLTSSDMPQIVLILISFTLTNLQIKRNWSLRSFAECTESMIVVINASKTRIFRELFEDQIGSYMTHKNSTTRRYTDFFQMISFNHLAAQRD